VTSDSITSHHCNILIFTILVGEHIFEAVTIALNTVGFNYTIHSFILLLRTKQHTKQTQYTV